VTSFRSLVVLKRPRDELWTIMRDHLVAFAGNLADIQEVRQIERTLGPDGRTHIVNEWHARQQIPAPIRSMLKIEAVSWIDRNCWDDESGTCSWRIEPSFLAGSIACSGVTSFTEAMAGRGTRVTFAGKIDLKPGLLGALGSMESTVSGFVEAIIPRNLRAVVEAAAAFELPGEARSRPCASC
jgi:hypothetical protein